tara:strand:- start:3879 stop:4319 length:441 start_codon:yes stop_codon:yes gene_type:complete
MKIIKIKEVKTPERKGKNAGIDFFIPSSFKKRYLKPNKQIIIPSGIKVKIPEGYCLIAFNKSSIAAKYNLQVGACLIDENYTGEIHINLFNVGNKSILLKPDQKIIQFVMLKPNYTDITLFQKEEDIFKKSDYIERGSKGFGSTGK